MRLRTIASVGFALAATAGLSLAQAPSVQPPSSGRAPALVVPAPVPAVPPPPPAYERKGRRDPFEPIEVLPPDVRPHAVASARLRGIVRGRSPRALLETSDGMGYILKPGDIFADGRLIEIGPDSVVFSVAPRRGTTTDRVVLRLPTD